MMTNTDDLTLAVGRRNGQARPGAAKRDGSDEGQGGNGMQTHAFGGIVVRAASLGELDAIHALEVAAFPDDRLSRRSLHAFIAAPHRPLIVAKFGDALAGYALLAVRKGGKTARLYSLAVDPAQARRGVGRALLQACERYARAHGRSALRLEVRDDNASAIALYEKMGYRHFGRYEDYYADGAVALRFEKRLEAPPSERSREIA
jgi:ribosomal protein S18 acetylase RimI-like enzyme